MFDFSSIKNLDLLSVAIAIAGIGILGLVVYFNNRRSSTNKAVLFFSLAAILWSIFNYSYYQFSDAVVVLWLLRIHAFFAIWYTFSLFNLFFVFPSEHVRLPRFVKFGLVPIAILASILSLTPFVFQEVTSFTSEGRISGVTQGPGIAVFGGVIIFLVITGFIILVRRLSSSPQDTLMRQNLILLLIGGIITFVLHIIFNLVLPGAFNNPRFVPLGGVFIFPFILFTSYAILRNKLFNIKVAGTAILVFALAIVTFSEVILAGQNISLLLFRGIVFTLVLLFGILLIRGVLREVEQREYIQILANDLSRANSRLRELDRQKSEFVSIASHQLRSPLTAISGYAALVLDGSYGAIPEGAKEAVRRISDSSYQLVNSVEDFLNVSRIEQGRMKYDLI